MGTQTSLASLASLLASLQPQLAGLKKYETSFPASAQQLLQRTLRNAEAVQALLAAVAQDGEETTTGILGYLKTGRTVGPLKTATVELQTNMNGIVAGSMQVPRNAKEGLSTLRLQLLGVKIELPAEQQRLAEQLDKLCEELGKHSPGQDIDVVEAQLDGLTKQLLQQVHATDSLESETLGKELAALEAGVAASKAAGRDGEAQFYSLVLNSLQRLHASQMHLDESDDDPSDPEEPADVDEDEDDPFYMPMPGAIKWADDRKFSMLAQPLGPEQPESKQFMIMMETDGEAPPEEGAAAAERASTGAAHGAASAAAAEAAEADDAGSETPAEAASAAEQLDASPAPGEEAAQPGSARVSGTGKVSASGRASSTSGAAAAGGALVEAEPPAEGTPENAAGTPDQPQQEKLRQFVNFLSGENPGACMFHAQMRLSVEGCLKLANFLKSSARVRALSLSHNYLGDEGLGLICQGLKVNKSVTALDLPDNNIGDQGIIYLVDAIKDNPSLTQLQLAYNKIGDQGAAALAKVIASSNSLKKLGLSFNAIGRPGCQALIHAISNNQSLKHLQILPGNPVEEKDAKALAKALKRNKKFSIRTFLGIGE